MLFTSASMVFLSLSLTSDNVHMQYSHSMELDSIDGVWRIDEITSNHNHIYLDVLAALGYSVQNTYTK